MISALYFTKLKFDVNFYFKISSQSFTFRELVAVVAVAATFVVAGIVVDLQCMKWSTVPFDSSLHVTTSHS